MIRQKAQKSQNKGTHKGTAKMAEQEKEKNSEKQRKNLEIVRFQGFSMAGAQGLELDRMRG